MDKNLPKKLLVRRLVAKSKIVIKLVAMTTKFFLVNGSLSWTITGITVTSLGCMRPIMMTQATKTHNTQNGTAASTHFPKLTSIPLCSR